MNQIRPYGIATLPNNYGDYYFYVDYEGEIYNFHDVLLIEGHWGDYLEANKQKYFDDIATQLVEWEKTKGVFITTTFDEIGAKEKEIEVFIPKTVYVKPIINYPKPQIEILKDRIAVLEEDSSTTKLQVEALEVASIGIEEKPIE